VKPNELLRKMKKNKDIKQVLRVVAGEGDGSHRMVYYKNRKAPLRIHKEMNKATIKEWFKQLGINYRDVF